MEYNERKQQAPVSYELVLQPGEKSQLAFASSYYKHHYPDDLEDYEYIYNGRRYRSVETLWAEMLEELSDSVFIGRDAYGEKVLRIRTGIPTFDDSDREWDSEEDEYLFFDGKDIHLVVMRGGYRIARLTFYEKLLTADLRLKPIFEKLGWPVNRIAWI